MSNDHGSNGPGEQTGIPTTPPSALANAIARSAAAGTGSVAFSRITPRAAGRAAQRPEERATRLALGPTRRDRDIPGPSRRVSRLAICLTMVLNVAAGTEAGAMEDRADPIACCPSAANHASRPTGPADGRPGVIADDAEGPDHVADHTGGIAARLRRSDGTALPGHLYLMMATVGSHEHARLFEQTPFTHNRGQHADTIESNHLAVEAAEAITGNDIEHIDFTTAPGGGPSGGLIYLIAYLNLVSHGAFTANMNVAATGQIEDEGYLGHIKGVDEKLGAAHLAEADVFFTASPPSHAKVAEHAGRYAGHIYRSRYGRATLAPERGLDDYESWGASRPDALDVVVVGHIADVAAYLCGAASHYACAIADQLGATTTSDTLTAYDIARAANTLALSLPLGHPNSGALQ